MERSTFDGFRRFIYEASGITLGDGKEALVSARIGKRMRALGFEDAKVYLEHVRAAGTESEELVLLLDAISTNVTSFYREPQHFTFLSQAIREWIAKGQRRFRIWCAAASTGEEPFTILMTLAEAGALELDTRLLATDISTKVLRQCQQATYSADKLKGVDDGRRRQWFEGDGSGNLRVKSKLRSHVLFKRLNLSTPPFPMKGPMDVVFCRNVMIYFDNHVRQRLLDEVNRLLKPGGFLMVGHAESLTGLMTGFKTVQPSVYQKR